MWDRTEESHGIPMFMLFLEYLLAVMASQISQVLILFGNETTVLVLGRYAIACWEQLAWTNKIDYTSRAHPSCGLPLSRGKNVPVRDRTEDLVRFSYLFKDQMRVKDA